MIEMTVSDFAPVSDPGVTLCPTGKRAKDVVARAPVVSSIPVTTSTALSKPKATPEIPTAENDRRPADERKAAAARASAMSVALAQPHRVGEISPDDPRLAFPLGRFCAKNWPRDRRFADSMHAAGEHYAGEIRAVKVARGFNVEDCDAGIPHGDGAGGDPTKEQIEEDRAFIQAAELALAGADAELRSVMPRCPSAMVRLCYDYTEPLAHDVDMLKHGLYLLAMRYGVWDRGRHSA
jgi:hypothetical protein